MKVPTLAQSDNCPLCQAPARPYFTDRKRPAHYLRCSRCELIFLSREHRLSPEAEKAHYQQHQNRSDDTGYRAFLDRLWQPLRERLSHSASGLDYGSGPGPALHLMAREAGFRCDHYDPYFHPDTNCLKENYDFITCSETAEHFHTPGKEFGQLADMLQPQGFLAVMTTRHQDSTDFSQWSYRMDHTHVAFYNDQTFRHIVELFGFRSIEFISREVAILQK